LLQRDPTAAEDLRERAVVDVRITVDADGLWRRGIGGNTVALNHRKPWPCLDRVIGIVRTLAVVVAHG
jgi:hypothetical protein